MVFLIISLISVVNSSIVIDKIARKFAPDYNLSYRHISGNVFTGIKIDQLKYNDQTIANDIIYRWDPFTLLQKKISIDKIKIEDADIEVIKALIASFDVDDSDDNSSDSFHFDVGVDNISISLNAFQEEGITFYKTILTADDVTYFHNGAVEVENLSLDIDSNLTKFSFNGSMKKRKLLVNEISIKALNSQMLEMLISQFTDMNNTKEPVEKKREIKPNPLIPKWIEIKKLYSNVLPANYDPVQLKQLVLNIENLIFDTDTLLFKNANIDLNATSNLTNLIYRGDLKNNHLAGQIDLTPNKPLFDLYNLPLRKEAFGVIVIDFNASKESVFANVKAKAKHILLSSKEAFNIDIDDLNSDIVYHMKSGSIKADTKLKVTTPYAKKITVSNHFNREKNISYSGKISSEKLIGVEPKFSALLKDITLQYKGSEKNIRVELDAHGIKGNLISSDFQKALLHLETKKELMLSELLKIPDSIKETKVNAVVDMPIDFQKPVPFHANAVITSNMVNMDMDILYGKKMGVKAKVYVPEKSLLQTIDKNIHWSAISPLMINAEAGEKTIHAVLHSSKLDADMNMQPFDGIVEGKINFSGFSTTFSGNIKKDIVIRSEINSFKSLFQTINEFYAVKELPNVDGKLGLTLRVNQKSEAFLKLYSPHIIYHAGRKTVHTLEDVNINISKKGSNIQLVSYRLNYNDIKIFATKASKIEIDESRIVIDPLWLNDELQFSGTYDLKTKQGDILGDAKVLKFKHPYADIDTKVNIKTLLEGNTTSLNGKITLLGGKIKYDISQKSFASDSDIIIVQEMKNKKPSPFIDNLSANIQIDTKEPLVLKQGAINIRLKPELGVNKVAKEPPLVLGTVELLKGGSYIFEGKRFVLDKSFIHFTGNINKPLLEIKVKYKAINHLIHIDISGTPDAPVIHFSSTPSLTKEQILSVILFDSEVGGDTHSGDEMMKMMGGAMAKAALSDIGIKLDHLVLGEGNSVEVGKKLTNKITIIYINDVVSSVKLKYEHSPHTESVIEVSEESQSYDIIYKRDF